MEKSSFFFYNTWLVLTILGMSSSLKTIVSDVCVYLSQSCVCVYVCVCVCVTHDVVQNVDQNIKMFPSFYGPPATFHVVWPSNSNEEIRFSSISDAFASEVLENLEDIFP